MAATARAHRPGVEAIIWTPTNQLGLERHGGLVPAGLWAPIVQRVIDLAEGFTNI